MNGFDRLSEWVQDRGIGLRIVFFYLFIVVMVIGLILTYGDYQASYLGLQMLDVNMSNIPELGLKILALAPQVLQIVLFGYAVSLLTKDDGTDKEIENARLQGLLWGSIALMILFVDLYTDFIFGYQGNWLQTTLWSIFAYFIASEVCFTLGLSMVILLLSKTLEDHGQLFSDLIGGFKSLITNIKNATISVNSNTNNQQRGDNRRNRNRNSRRLPG